MSRKEIKQSKDVIKERIFLQQKGTAKQENAVLSQVLQQKKYMQIIRQSRNCHIFVRNIDKTVGFLCHHKYKRTQSKRSYSFTKAISMGKHQCPKCERQFARSDSLRRHLTSGICSEDMESETMSENEDSTMRMTLWDMLLKKKDTFWMENLKNMTHHPIP